MPAYDYYCPKCESEKEVSHGMFEEVDIICEECGEKMRKKISGGTFHLKGVGWASKGNKPKAVHTKEYGVAVQPGMEGALNPDIQKAIKKR